MGRDPISKAKFGAVFAGLLALGSAFSAIAVSPAQAEPGLATLTIRVENVAPQGGTLRLGLYTAAAYPDDASKPVASADVKAEMGETVITLRDVPPGIYAIETYQDVNSNGKMDTSWFGLPLEPYGFSRDVRPYLSKPGFAAVKFTLAAGDSSQTLHLQNSVSLLASK